MYVKNHMVPKEKLTILQTEETLNSALDKIREGDFLSLPVFEGEVFKGILLKEAIFRRYFETGETNKEKYLNETKIKEIYTEETKTIQDTEYIESASYLLNELRTPFLAVLNDQDRFVGILTHKAIFSAFSEVFGFKDGHRIVIDAYDVPGQIAKLTDIIKRENVNIMNFAVKDAKVMDVFQIVVRVKNCDIESLIEKIKTNGFKVSGVDA